MKKKKKYYQVVSIDGMIEQLVVADNYKDAVGKIMAMEDFCYLFGEGFQISLKGEILW